MLKAVLFDMDDTLLDWSHRETDWSDYHRVHIGYVLDHIRQYVPDIDVDPAQVSDTMVAIMEQSWRDASSTLRAPHIGNILVQTFAEHGVITEQLTPKMLMTAYQWSILPGVRPFEDVYDVLETLSEHNILLGIITNAPQPMWMRLKELVAFDLVDYFVPEALISAADVGYLKPHPKIFNHALQQLNVDAGEAVFVGDSREADILGAKNVGMYAVLRTRPDSTAILNHKIKPDALVHSLIELYTLLDDWFPGWRKD